MRKATAGTSTIGPLEINARAEKKYMQSELHIIQRAMRSWLSIKNLEEAGRQAKHSALSHAWWFW